MSDIAANGYVLTMEHRFEAPRDRVFQAWTNPEMLRKWWAAAEQGTTAIAEIDLRTGGTYRLGMRNPDNGEVYTVGGEFREVVEPALLVYTWTWETTPALPGSDDSLVTVEFIEERDGTLVRLTHSRFATEAVRDMHSQGWGGCLANLERRVFPVRTPDSEST